MEEGTLYEAQCGDLGVQFSAPTKRLAAQSVCHVMKNVRNTRSPLEIALKETHT